MKRLKYSRRLDTKEIKIVVTALTLYQEQITNEKKFDRIGKFIESFYTDDKLAIEKKIASLEAKGYKVTRLAS